MDLLAELVDRLLSKNQETEYLAGMTPAHRRQKAVQYQREDFLSFITSIEQRLAELEQGRYLCSTDSLKATLDGEILRLQELVAKHRSEIAIRDQAPPPSPFDRKGLDNLWMKMGVDRDKEKQLREAHIDPATYRRWLAGNGDDGRGKAGDIVDFLVSKLRPLGVDLTRFGVR